MTETVQEPLVVRAERGEFSELFRFDLNWGAPDTPPVTVKTEDGAVLTATNVSSYKGLRVWECPRLPGSALEAKLEQLIAKSTNNRLVIFHEGDRQVWRWPSRTSKGNGVATRPARHVHRSGSPDPRFAMKIDAIRLPDDRVLDVNTVLRKVRAAFDVETKQESRLASTLMARLYAAAEKGYSPTHDSAERDHEISVTLARILFLLFGDDTEMWEVEQFQDFVKDHTSRDGSDIGERLNQLFEVLDTPPAKRNRMLQPALAKFPYVNGAIFGEPITLPALDNDFRRAILDASAADWSAISPAIFGSMFQSVRDAQTRRELGEHYTSEENILKTLEPLFLDDLREGFAEAMKRETPKQRKNSLSKLWAKLGEIRYLDPACGCGNFIIVAYRELRGLELEIIDALASLQTGTESQALETDWTGTLKVTLDHFYGIEIDEWPAQIARTAMFLIDRQCDLRLKERFGIAPDRLPIRREATIVVGNALRIDWSDHLPPSESVIIAGNPPFVGQYSKSDLQTKDVQNVWGDDYDGYLDYVTAWYAKCLQYFHLHNGSWAFVSTNSICQGQAVSALFGPVLRDAWHIKFAYRTFPWDSDAAGKAAVHCVIVGFTRANDNRQLFDHTGEGRQTTSRTVDNISPYLVASSNLLVRKRSRPVAHLPSVVYGSKPADGGHLQVSKGDVAEVRRDRIAGRFLRPFVGAEELLNGNERWCLWLVDAKRSDLRDSPVLRSRLALVRAARAASRKFSTRAAAATPHLFTEVRQPSVAYLCVPSVVSERRRWFPAARLSADVITSNAAFTAPDEDGLLFAIVSSSMFMTWQRTIGGRLKSDLRFSNTVVWNNLPLPPFSATHRQGIIEAGKGVLEARGMESHKSLAQHYAPGQLSEALQAAHHTLDEVVDPAFGATSECTSEEQRQEILFQRYQELTAAADE